MIYVINYRIKISLYMIKMRTYRVRDRRDGNVHGMRRDEHSKRELGWTRSECNEQKCGTYN